ncbi:MAG: caspase family protein, partial [Desulfobacterales bacterium]|nr:caspase family protein [Desulfobacterales bacterium]
MFYEFNDLNTSSRTINKPMELGVDIIRSKLLIVSLFMITMYFWLLPIFAHAASRGISVISDLSHQSGKLGAYKALIIGINDYKDPNIPDLETSVNDANAMANLFAEYQKTQFPEGKTDELLDLEKKLAYKLKTYNEELKMADDRYFEKAASEIKRGKSNLDKNEERTKDGKTKPNLSYNKEILLFTINYDTACYGVVTDEVNWRSFGLFTSNL